MATSRADAVLLGVAVVAVSTSAPLTREAAAPALAIAFWRNGLASAGLVPVAAGAHLRRGRQEAGAHRSWAIAAAAGVLLGAHFAAWISSLSLTTVAASVALVSTQPVWAALMARALGERVGRQGWLGVALALVGVAIAGGVDIGGSARVLRGDLLALAGGILAAAYVTVGTVARRHLTTIDYTAGCYSVATVVVLGMAVVGGQRLAGFDGRTWLCIAAIAVGPQLLGHSVFNRLLATVGPLVVSVAVLGEIVGASLLAAWWFGERPPAAIVPAAGCIVAGVVLVVRDRSGTGLAEIVAG
jgi:drug/metabolite transporter (DMT)-like permease